MINNSATWDQHPYETVLVRRAKPPPGAEGSNWHRYVIAFKGNNTIHGCRHGNRRTVTMAVQMIVAQLNERHYRHLSERSRVNLGLTPMKKTHKAKLGFWHVY